MTAQLFVKRTAVPFVLVVTLGVWWWCREQDGPSDSAPPSATAVRTNVAPGPDPTVAPVNADQAQTNPSAPANVLAGALDRWSEKSAFRNWAGRYLAASPEDRPALVEDGVALAAARRPVFKTLIAEDPREALRQAVPPIIRQELPAALVAQLEERVNERAALRVYQGVGEDNRSPALTVRIAEFPDGRNLQAHVYGRRAESVRWLAGTSLNGVALDQEFAVHEDPIRTLEPGERPDATLPAVAVCPVSGRTSIEEENKGQPVTVDTPAIEAFGEIVYLCNGAHVTVYREQLIYAEGGTGGPMSFTGILPAAPTPSIGNVRVLVIPLTFADQNDTPSSESTLYQLMRDVGEHYALASYGKLTLLTTVAPPIRLPHNEAWYIQKDTSNGGSIDGLGLEHSHGRAEARKLGFDDSEFDCVVVRLRGGPRTAGGYGGGSSVWIYGDGVDVTAHEVGHAFGLAHANFWDTAGTSAIGAGSNGEYGGHWDVMGGIGLPFGHYNVQGKNQIRWLPNEYVSEVTASGTYRIHAQDQPVLDPSRRFALRIRKDNLRTYWGELRGLYTGHATRTWADQGLILGWRFPGGGGGNWQLIDTTPGSPFAKDDSPISLGRTFSDPEAGIHLTTMAVNPATATEPKSLDVVVNLGTFPSNRPPVLALAASATVVPLNAPVTFTATADDPDGDPLAYAWQHFGDANYRAISPSAPVITRTFTAAGSYLVTCTASDMKGGRATRSLLITAGNGGGRFTVSGRVTFNGAGLEGVIVNANAANGVITDSDGRYTIPNLVAATYTMTPLLYGYAFTELFNNSIAVGPAFDGADFEAAATPRVSLEATTPTCRESVPGAPAEITLTRTGDTSQALTVNVLAPSGTATATSDYALAPPSTAGSQGFSTLTFPAEVDTIVLTATPVNDAAAEGPETVIIELAPGNGYRIEGLARVTLVIDDDDSSLPKVSLTMGEAKTVEGSVTAATIVVARTGSTTGALVVPYTVGGTASAADFETLSGVAIFPAGASSVSLNITSRNDDVSEPLETVVIRISSSAGFIADPVANSATVAIVDDDVQIVTVMAADAVAAERDLSVPGAAADVATFLVTRAGDLSQPLTVYYAMSGTNGGLQTALHGVDYEALPGVLTLPAGRSSGAITIVPRWDGLGEGPESVRLQLGAGPTNYRLGTPNSAYAVINDAGDPPYVEVLCTDNAVEGGTVGHFRFSLKGSVAGNVTVNYSLAGTAVSGADFTGLTGSVTIPGNGFNFVDVNVTAVDDASAEDLETIVLTLSPSPLYQVFGPTGTARMFVRDNEQPVVFVDANAGNYPPSLAENGGTGGFYVSRAGSTTASLAINYTLSGTAGNGQDYQLLSGAATIAAGALGVDIPIVPINDGLAEGTEAVTLTLAPGGYGRGPAATLYLTDDETPSIVVGFPTSSAAGSESASPGRVPVRLSAASGAAVTVEYVVESGARSVNTASGSAPSPLPYWVRCDRMGSVIRGAISLDGQTWTGVSTQTVALPNTGYLAGLHVCSFNTSLLSTSVFDSVTVSNLQPGGSLGARTSANIGTTALAGSFGVVGSTYTVAGAGDNVEGTTDQGYFVYWPINNSTSCTIVARVVSQQNTAVDATAGVMIREGTANNVRRGYMAATPGAGFEFHYRTATAATEVKATTVVGKPLWVRLQRAGDVLRAFQSGDGAAWTSIGTNLDLVFAPEVFVGLATSAQAEGQLATAVFDQVTLTPGPLPPLPGRTIGLTATQGVDREEAGTYTVTASADGLNGTSDDFHFLAAPVSGNFTLTARIVSLTGTGASPQAGLVVRESYLRRARSVFVGGVPGTAPQLIWRPTTTTTAHGDGIDFTLPGGVLTFPPGSTTQDITIDVIDDSRPEPDETMTVLLRNANGARLSGLTQFTYVIVDNDSPPALPYVGFAAGASSAPEAAGFVHVPVALSTAATGPVTVDYATTDGSAVQGLDYLGSSGTLTFNSGDTVQSIAVVLLDNGSIQTDRKFTLALGAVAGGQASTLVSHEVTITDDDRPVVTLSSTDTNASEGGDPALVTLTRVGSTNETLEINLGRAGTATAGSDYTGVDATAILPAGVVSLTLVLAATQDALAESTETVLISVAPGSGYSPGPVTNLTVRIADDDRNVVSIEATGGTAMEGGTNGVFTLSRSGVTTASLTVALTVVGTATAADYTTTPSSITSIAFAAGQSTRTIIVAPINDPAIEGDEVLLVQIAAGPYDIGGLGYASLTIVDNDVPPTVFISSPAAHGVVVATGNGVEFAVTAEDDGQPQPLTYGWTQVAGPGTVTFETPQGAHTPATFSAPGTYRVRVTVNDGQFSASDQITVNVGGTNALPASDWISSDVGPATLRGYAGTVGSNWVVFAAGIGYATSSDRAHAVTRQVAGDGSIVARLVAITGTNTAEAGLSVRDSLHRYARRGALVYNPSTRTLRFRPRLVSNTTDFTLSAINLNLPLWLRLDRNAATGTVTAFYAADVAGAPGSWTQVGTNVNIAMDAIADYSLTADSGSDTVGALATFDQVTLIPTPAGPAFVGEDFGGGDQAGSYAYVAATDLHTLMGRGGLDGSGFFRGHQVSGDFVLTVFLTNATSSATDARSGLMVRDSMDDGPMAFLGRIPTGSYPSFVWRTNPKGGTSGLNGITQRRRWLRLVRRGNQITALHAADVNNTPGPWAQLGQPQTVFLQPTVLVGLYCDNAGGGAVGLNTATFTKLSVVPLNKAPVVDSGPAPAGSTLPLALAGDVTDDGLPRPLVTEWAVVAAPGPVTFADSNAVVTTVTVVDNGLHTLRLWADDGIARTYDNLSFDYSGGPTPFAAWQAANFPGGGSNPNAAPDANPDGDALNNLGEYGHGTDPQMANASPITTELVTIGADQFLRVNVPKNPQATDVIFTVEGAEAVTGPWSAAGLVIEVDTATQLQVRDSVPATATSRFLRVRLTMR